MFAYNYTCFNSYVETGGYTIQSIKNCEFPITDDKHSNKSISMGASSNVPQVLTIHEEKLVIVIAIQ